MESDYSRDTNFYEALTKEDELGCVVRAHLHVEYLVDQLLALHFTNGRALSAMQLDYSARVRLLEAFGYDEDALRSLQALGTLRNDFAHKLDFKLTDNRLDDFYKILASETRQSLHRIYADERNKRGGTSYPKKLKQLKGKDRFTFYATTIRTTLINMYHAKRGEFPAGVRPRTPSSVGEEIRELFDRIDS